MVARNTDACEGGVFRLTYVEEEPALVVHLALLWALQNPFLCAFVEVTPREALDMFGFGMNHMMSQEVSIWKEQIHIGDYERLEGLYLPTPLFQTEEDTMLKYLVRRQREAQIGLDECMSLHTMASPTLLDQRILED